MKSRRVKDLILRGWLYFRVGHGTYWHYLMAFAQWIVVIYSLYVVTSPLSGIFQTIQIFMFFFFPVYIGMCLLAGYIHYKISQAYQTEIEVTTEAHPFVYRVLKNSKEMMLLEYNIFQSAMMLRIAKALRVLSEEEEKEWLTYIAMLEHLRNGKDIREFSASMPNKAVSKLEG